MTIALLFLLALLLSAALVPVCRMFALRLGYVQSDQRPAAPRPKALFGGVAVALTLFGCSAAVGAFEVIPVLLACSAVLFALGVAGDLYGLRPSTKLVAIIAVASVFLFFGYRLHWAESQTLDSIVTLFWIAGITSAFNLLDNMDGLCAGIALIAGAAFLATILPVDATGVSLLRAEYLAILLGAITGFLFYNIHPASVVLGESGSLLIGFSMAAMTLRIAPGRATDLVSIVAVPLMLVMIPIVDATLVALARLTRGSEAGGGRAHSSHRLVALGLSERTAVGLLWLLAGVSGLIGVAADRSRDGLAGLVAVVFTIGMALFAVYLARVRVHDSSGATEPSAGVTPLGIDSGYRRRLAEILLDSLLVSVAYYGAYRLRFDTPDYLENFPYFLQSFPIVLGTQVLALSAVGAYRGTWRYFSLSDGVTFAKGVFVGVVTAQAVVFYAYRFESYSPGVFVVYGMLLLCLLVSSRASVRLISDFAHRQRSTGKRLVIYGAGDAGSIAVRYLLSDPRSAYRIIGFVDDDVRKRTIRVHGYRVFGGYDHLAGMIMAHEVDVVAVTHNDLETPALAGLCARHGVALFRLAIDWREIPAAAEAAGAEGAVSFVPSPSRVVPFTDARRERSRATPSPLYEVSSDAHDGSPRGSSSAPLMVEAPAVPIRVVHIITRLILGGAQENTLYTAIGQHRDPRFDVTLLCGIDEAGEGNMFAEANRAGVTTVVLPSLLREIRPLTDLKAVFDVYRFLRRGSYTVVHTHSTKAGMIGRIAAWAARVPVVVHTLHGLVFHEFQSAWRNSVYVTLKRICAPMTHKIISVSDRVSATAIARGVGRPDQHITIFSGIELDRFLSVRERLSVEEAKRRAGIPPAAPVVGKIARLFPLKGHEQFLAAAVDIAREVPGAYFLLVGDGPLRDELRANADQLGLGPRLVMVGRVPPEMVPDYIQAMDVVVHTSLREGIARVLPQAGAVGKPVVTFDLDGAPEVIRDGVSGYLVPAVETGRIADRTVELLRDPERRHALGEAGRAFAAEHFSVERMVERINAVYFELLANAKPV